MVLRRRARTSVWSIQHQRGQFVARGGVRAGGKVLRVARTKLQRHGYKAEVPIRRVHRRGRCQPQRGVHLRKPSPRLLHNAQGGDLLEIRAGNGMRWQRTRCVAVRR